MGLGGVGRRPQSMPRRRWKSKTAGAFVQKTASMARVRQSTGATVSRQSCHSEGATDPTLPSDPLALRLPAWIARDSIEHEHRPLLFEKRPSFSVGPEETEDAPAARTCRRMA